MIFRRYGTTYQSVDIDFDAKALNEIAFRRNRQQAIGVDEFDASYKTVETHALATEAQGSVQSETEQRMLDLLKAQILQLEARLSDGQVLVVDNEPGHDYPKPRQNMKNVIVEGENRLHFEYTMGPPLRVSVRQPNG